MIVAVESRTDLLFARINLSAQGSSFTQPDVQRPQQCPACFVIYGLRSNCAPLQTRVPAVLIVTAVSGTNQ